MLEASYPSVHSGEQQETLFQASCKVNTDLRLFFVLHVDVTHTLNQCIYPHITHAHTEEAGTYMISVGKMGFGTSIPKKPPGFGVRQTRIPLSYFLSMEAGASFTLAVKTPLCQGYLPPGAIVRMRRDYACKTTMGTMPGTKQALNK